MEILVEALMEAIEEILVVHQLEAIPTWVILVD